MQPRLRKCRLCGGTQRVDGGGRHRRDESGSEHVWEPVRPPPATPGGGHHGLLLEADPDDFDFALDGTADMDGIAADDTIDMASVVGADGPELDISDDVGLDDTSLDDLALELDTALDSDGDAEDAEHLQTLSLDGEDDGDQDDSAEKTVIMPVDADVERQSDADEADTKLNLAKAYIELGDTEGARSILDEVAVDGNEAQTAEAKTLLDQLTG